MSLWVTVSVGISVAYELYLLGVVLSVATLGGLHLLKPLKRHPDEADQAVHKSDKS